MVVLCKLELGGEVAKGWIRNVSRAERQAPNM